MMKIKKAICGFVCLMFAAAAAWGQPAPGGTETAVKAFRGFEIGMGLETVKDLLKKDPYFNYRGDPDVYFLPGKEQLLIECSGNMFVQRAYFQFVDKKLFTLIMDLDVNKIDFSSLLTTIQAKYGLYKTFAPQVVVWELGGVRLALEKPLTIKYIDIAVFNRLKDAGSAVESSESQTLKDFLKEF